MPAEKWQELSKRPLQDYTSSNLRFFANVSLITPDVDQQKAKTNQFIRDFKRVVGL